MSEVAVAFPNDEPTAQLIASRLNAAGIAARVDRGLSATYQVATRGHITVLVDERHARKAHKVLGTTPHPVERSERVLRFAIAVAVVIIGIGLATILALLLLR